MFTREFDYAARVVRALSDGKQKTVKLICESENVPQPYAYKILKKLENASLVSSTRGAYGGYRLSRSISAITLFDIYIAIEEMMCITDCLKEGYQCHNNTGGRKCKVHETFLWLQDELILLLKSKTMAEILADDLA